MRGNPSLRLDIKGITEVQFVFRAACGAIPNLGDIIDCGLAEVQLLLNRAARESKSDIKDLTVEEVKSPPSGLSCDPTTRTGVKLLLCSTARDIHSNPARADRSEGLGLRRKIHLRISKVYT